MVANMCSVYLFGVYFVTFLFLRSCNAESFIGEH
jgi:hypothetical protein